MQNQTTETSKKTARDAKQDDIVDVILEDHKPLKELIKIMKDSEASPAERMSAFKEFAPLLIAHAKPEEEILYRYMKTNIKLREEGFEGEVEHGLADQLLEESKRTDDEDLLLARIKVLAELVEHHIKEEESDLLPDFKESSKEAERIDMGNKFLKLKVDYLAAGDDNIIPDPKLEQEQRRKH